MYRLSEEEHTYVDCFLNLLNLMYFDADTSHQDVLQNAGKENCASCVQNIIAPGYPFTEAEVLYSLRHEWVVKAEDILARRTRLAFLNKEAALAAIPKVVEIMGTELGWNSDRKLSEIQSCHNAIDVSFAGPVPRATA